MGAVSLFGLFWKMFKNTFQSGFLSILYSIGSKPLQIWDKKVKLTFWTGVVVMNKQRYQQSAMQMNVCRHIVPLYPYHAILITNTNLIAFNCVLWSVSGSRQVCSPVKHNFLLCPKLIWNMLKTCWPRLCAAFGKTTQFVRRQKPMKLDKTDWN